ncbi:DUF4847 family protein [Bacteroides congonensis]|uniref:DUF4847 family protein n=1 Tax=Bacteroides congonensis TaxID=1871006 RepID=UPI00267441A4|nr:DUF4847 family protein [Bacteroides congonensis]
MKKNIFQIVGLFLLLPLFAGCNDTDDLSEIFIRKWKLTYITKPNEHKWYSFPGIDNSNYDEYYKGEKSFILTLSGIETDNEIQGTFIGEGSVNAGGTWNANGKNQQFNMTVEGGSPTDSKDKIAGKILEGLKSVNSYKGSDSKNLFLYYQDATSKETLCLTFAPSRN